MSAPSPPSSGAPSATAMWRGAYRRDFTAGEGPPRLALSFRSIPAAELPPDLNGMPITAEVAAAYRGHESLLDFRSLHSAPCYARFDAVRKCFVAGLAPHTEAECRNLFEEYRSCSIDLKQRLLQRRLAAEEAARRARASVVLTVGPEKGEGGGAPQ